MPAGESTSQFYEDYFRKLSTSLPSDTLPRTDVHTEWLLPIWDNLDRIFQDSLSLLILPRVISLTARRELVDITCFVQAIATEMVAARGTAFDIDALLAKAKKAEAERAQAEQARNDLSDDAEKVLSHILNRLPDLRNPIRAIGRSLLLAGWTGFEVTATDLWIAMVNRNPVELGPKVAKAQADSQEKEGVGKHISFAALSRYGYDLRSCLGEVFKSKFNFNSLQGLREAYSCILPETVDDSLLSNPALNELEATRHLLVHRGGVIDAVYKKRVPNSPDVGTELVLAASSINLMQDAGVEAACGLIRTVDKWESGRMAAIGRSVAGGRH